MNKKIVIWFLAGWLFSLVFSPATIMGFLRPAPAPAS